MATSEVAQAAINWSTLVPVIVGGSIAVVGGVLGAIVSQWISAKTESKKRRAEKFEEMNNALYEYVHWLKRQRSILVYGSEEVEHLSPLSRAQAIAVIYFPIFSQRLLELETVGNQFEIWMYEASLKRLDGKLDELNDGLLEAAKPYQVKFIELKSEIANFAKHEFR